MTSCFFKPSSSAGSTLDEKDFQGDPVSISSLDYPLPKPASCKLFPTLTEETGDT